MSYVDIMKINDNEYLCTNWCGRTARYRGNFCKHCSWDDLFYGMINHPDRAPNMGWGEAFELLWIEML